MCIPVLSATAAKVSEAVVCNGKSGSDIAVAPAFLLTALRKVSKPFDFFMWRHRF
jgi:hypothetical protein